MLGDVMNQHYPTSTEREWPNDEVVIRERSLIVSITHAHQHLTHGDAQCLNKGQQWWLHPRWTHDREGLSGQVRCRVCDQTVGHLLQTPERKLMRIRYVRRLHVMYSLTNQLFPKINLQDQSNDRSSSNDQSNSIDRYEFDLTGAVLGCLFVVKEASVWQIWASRHQLFERKSPLGGGWDLWQQKGTQFKHPTSIMAGIS